MNPSNSSSPVFRSLDIIESRIREKLTVENIASSVYFSKYHYQRLFREIVGDSVMEYVTKRKLTLAGRALLESDASVIDISAEYGYDSREGFMRSFKAYMGVTPTEYRKYGLASISKQTPKERRTMTYSKITEDIIRDMNENIAKARETAAVVRKAGASAELPQPFYGQFWAGMADRAGETADRMNAALQRICAIAECPDGINSRMNILKNIEDATFATNIMAFHAGVTVARSTPEYLPYLEPLSARFYELARVSALKTAKIAGFMNELGVMIITEMRESAAEKIQTAIRDGRAAAESIKSYENIRYEIRNIADCLADAPVENITTDLMDDLLYRFFIIQFTIDTDILRSGGADGAQFTGVDALRKSLEEARDFLLTLPSPEACERVETGAHKHMQDVAFQGNIILFYVRGEIEKITGRGPEDNGFITADQKEALGAVCAGIDGFIRAANNIAKVRVANSTAEVRVANSTIETRVANSTAEVRVANAASDAAANVATDVTAGSENLSANADDGEFAKAVETLQRAHDNLATVAGDLKEHGGAFRHINAELGALVERAASISI